MSAPDAVDKQKELVPGFTIAPVSTGPIDPIADVRFESRKEVAVSARQVPITSPYLNGNIWRYQASGQYNNALINGGQVQIKIDRGSGTGKCNGVPYIRLVVTNNNGSSSQYIPWPLTIQTMQLVTPDGTPIQNLDGSAEWNDICQSYSDDSWSLIQDAVNSSPYYEQGSPIPVGVSIYYIPLPGLLFGAADFFLPAVDGDMYLYVTFWPGSSTLTSGSGIQLTLMSLEVPMEQLSISELARQKDVRLSRELAYIYPYQRIQRITQPFNTNTTYPIPLNGIKGDVVMLRFYFRNSLTLEDLYHYTPIANFQILDSSGRQISGPQLIDEQYNRWIQQGDWNLGSASSDRHVYEYVFGSNKSSWMSVLLNGVKYGCYPFTTNETLNITTAGAGTSETYQLTFTQSAGGGTAVAPSNGTFTLTWFTPIDGAQVTLPIAYNASAAVLQAALEALVNFQGQCMVTTITNGWQIVMSGPYANKPLYDNGFQLSVNPSGIHTTFTIGSTTVTDIAIPQSMNLAITAYGVAGITNGNTYILDIHAYTTSYVQHTSSKGLKVYTSG